ncbi:MAG: hypothetical protein QOF02_3183 [Blastocatellia bacterium]|jgi:hypothetical protein|nr:hypothetical protein [Blastocatellia bacterium]
MMSEHISAEAHARLDELTGKLTNYFGEISAILERELSGKELTGLEQAELRAITMTAEALRSGSLLRFIADDPQGARDMSMGIASVTINKLADHEAQTTEGTH